MPTLVIANKLYSSWSLRPWLLLSELGIPFDEVLIPLGSSRFHEQVSAYSGAGKVPVLVDDAVTVWESIAILEYAAERWAEAGVWPSDLAARTFARCIVAEMHAGFTALRSACPMNLGKRFGPRDRGAKVAADVSRIEHLWRDARARFAGSGPFLFGAFSAADAMYAPVVTRLNTYAVAVAADTRAYMDTVLSLPSFRRWREAALREPWTFAEDEADESPIEDLRASPGR